MSEKSNCRLDSEILKRGLVSSRSQAANLIKLGKILVDGKIVKKAGAFVSVQSNIELETMSNYVSRAGLKLESVAKTLNLDFRDKVVLDVGSSTGGFTDYALQNGAKKVVAVDVGTNQLHRRLRGNKRIELHEKTDIRNVVSEDTAMSEPARTDLQTDGVKPSSQSTIVKINCPDIILIDVSFISLRVILPYVAQYISGDDTQIVAMVKPQFEAGREQVNKGVIKNEAIRRTILHGFENWAKTYFVIINKRDSEVAGAKGNRERFYLLKLISKR